MELPEPAIAPETPDPETNQLNEPMPVMLIRNLPPEQMEAGALSIVGIVFPLTSTTDLVTLSRQLPRAGTIEYVTESKSVPGFTRV